MSYMLHLKLAADPRWVDVAAMNIEDILIDHAYCEMKAASTCISLINSFPDRTELVEKLMPVVTEEWGHFRQVVKELNDRGFELGKQRKDQYVNKLLEFSKKGGSREDFLLEKLLISALIEARSCERFKVLSENIKDDYMKAFYRKFMESEAGHYALFMNLALHYCDELKVRQRWAEYIEYETDLMCNWEMRSDRIH